MKALDMIAAERQRQQTEEGFTPEHDDEHQNGEIAEAAACYAAGTAVFYETDLPLWPWNPNAADGERIIQQKPRLRQLVIAGALIVAEIERLQRADPAPTEETNG